MHAVDNLVREHRLVSRVLDAFDEFVGRLERGVAIERHDLSRFVTFFREYADLGHHEKEEGIVFPALVNAGFGWDEGLVAEIRGEHNQERYLMRSLRHAALQKDGWSREDERHLISIARTFIDFERAHVAKENETLIPALRSQLAPDVASDVGRRLERFDQGWSEHGELPWLQRLADELIEQYPATRPLASAGVA